MNTKYYKKYIEKLIALDPIDITIKRKASVDDGYKGETTSDIVLAPQTVTMYKKKSHREVISDANQGVGYMVHNIEKILALYDADILEKDTFMYDGKLYKVKFAKGYLDVCKQIEVEVIK